MLTFSDWENYIDGIGTPRTLTWTADAMRGAPAYPYVMAIYRAAEMRRCLPTPALANVLQSGDVEIGRAILANTGGNLGPLLGFALSRAREGIVSTSVTYDSVGQLIGNWIKPDTPMVAGAVDPEPVMFEPLAGGDIATESEKNMILSLDPAGLGWGSTVGKFGQLAEVVLACKKVLATMRRRVRSNIVPVDGTAEAFRRLGSGATVEAAKSDFLSSGTTSAWFGAGEFSGGYSPLFGSVAISNVGATWTQNMPVGMTDQNNPLAVPYGVFACRRLVSNVFASLFSAPEYATPPGIPPFVYVDQYRAAALSHQWTQRLGFDISFPDHAFPAIQIDGDTYGYGELFAYVFDYQFPL